MRIGLLMPRSTLFPAFGLDILNGIKAYIHAFNIGDEVKIITDNIGFGIDDAEIYTKAEKMLLQEDADLLIAIADQRVFEMLEPLFSATNKLLLIVGMGANFPDTWRATPGTLVHSLNFSFLSHLTGKLAAEDTPGRKGAYAVSYYDAGYRQCYAMLTAHQQAGGIPNYTHVTHFKETEFSLDPLKEFLEKEKDVRTLMALFAGDLAEKFYREVNELKTKYELNFYVSPMMLDEQTYQSSNPRVDGINGYVPWISSLENESNELFKRSFHAKAGKPANYFALAGWETGQIISLLLKEFNSGNASGTLLMDAIADLRLQTPRGELVIDKQTGYTYGTPWLLRSDAAGTLVNTGALINAEAHWKDFTSHVFPSGENSSWKNTYLCV